jgi:hypothetical protein
MSASHLFATAPVQTLADAYGLTTDRAWATAAALVAVAGAIIGGLVLARTGTRKGAVVAMAAGLLALVNGALVVVTADGGPGTGNGVVGGYAALVIGLLATVLGGLALTRSRHTV